MKTIISFLISCITTISVFAQSVSTVRINVRGTKNEQLIVDNKSYIVNSDDNNAGANVPITITDILPGQHTLKVVRTDNINNDITASFNLRPGYDLQITIAANGSIQQRETKQGTNNTGSYRVAMSDADFSVLNKNISNQWRTSTRLNLVNAAFANTSNYFTTAQANQLIQLINSQSSRLSLAKASYPRIVDPANFTQVYSLLNSQAQRNELVAYVNNYNVNNSVNTGAMSAARFNNLYRTAQRQSTMSAKVSYLSGVFNSTNNYFTVAQAKQLIQLVSGESNRLHLAKISYKSIADPTNFSQIHELLNSQASRNELARFINSGSNNPDAVSTAMSDDQFNTIYRDVQNRFGPGAKQSALTDIFNSENNFFTAAQAKQLILLVSAESNRLQLAKLAYNDIVDQENFNQLYDVLASTSSRNELDTYVKNNYDYKGGIDNTTIGVAMSDAIFNKLYNDVSNRWGLGAKMSALTDIFNNESNFFTVMQAKQLIQLVSDESNRLQLAKSAYGNITDPQNFNLMYDVLASQSSKNELAAYINAYSYNR